MLLRLNENPTIKNLRNHSPETVEELRGLLSRGATASLDPRRKNFYELDGGTIAIDGRDISRIPRDELRSQLGMVLQDTHLFSGTILDNIRYGRLDATDEECIAAAKLVNAHSFIRRLPQGYQTLVGENGLLLSGGADIDPLFYGEAPHPTYQRAEGNRDTFEIELIRLALERVVADDEQHDHAEQPRDSRGHKQARLLQVPLQHHKE